MIFISFVLFMTLGMLMESQDLTDLIAYAFMGYVCGAIGFNKQNFLTGY
jgi:hypothetical protein